jgi:hypothetical protein
MLVMIRAAGAQPILFHAPTPSEVVYTPDARSRAPLLDFSDEQRYPALFLTEYRQDHGHLNEAGARVFSRLLAEEWIKLVDHQGR